MIENFLETKTGKFKKEFLHDISTGKFEVGHIMPSQRELAKLYRVSFSTVARVFAELMEENVIVAKRGSGGGTLLCKLIELNSNKKHLVFQDLISKSSRPYTKRFAQWMSQFKKDNPEITVEIEERLFSSNEIENMDNRFVAGLQNKLPSLMRFPITSLSHLIERKIIKPLLSDYELIEMEMNKFRPEITKKLIFSRQLYGYPDAGGANSVFLIYLDKALKNHSIELSSLMHSWPEWLQSMKKMSNGTSGIIVNDDFESIYLIWEMLLKERMRDNWLTSMYSWNGVMNSQAATEALADLKKINDEIGFDFRDGHNFMSTAESITTQQAAAAFISNSRIHEILSTSQAINDFRIAPMPSAVSNTENLLFNFSVWCLIREDDREAGWDFLRWSSLPHNWAYFYSNVSTGLSCRISPFNNEGEYKNILSFKHQDWCRINELITNHFMFFEPACTADFRNGIGKILISWLKSRGSVSQAREQLCGFWAAWVND